MFELDRSLEKEPILPIGKTLLGYACFYGIEDVVDYLLSLPNIDVNKVEQISHQTTNFLTLINTVPF